MFDFVLMNVILSSPIYEFILIDSIGSKISDGSLERRLKLAEGHIEVGRLLAFYQVRISPAMECFSLCNLCGT